MSMIIYAGKMSNDEKFGDFVECALDPVCFQETIEAPNSKELMLKGESPYIPNPEFIENSSMDLSTRNMQAFWGFLGMSVDTTQMVDHPIEDVTKAAMKACTIPAFSITSSVSTGANGAEFHDCGLSEDKMQLYIDRLMRLILLGIANGATHICVG